VGVKDILEVQNKLRQMAGVAPLKVETPKVDDSHNYKAMTTPDLQSKYNTVEAWLKTHKDHADFLRGTIELKRMNKELASRQSI
jgi:hypothetical protein